MQLKAVTSFADKETMRADWAHVFLSVLPTLPLASAKDEARVAQALKAACAGFVARHGAEMRRAAVAQFEVRLRVPDDSGAWRLVVSSPTGKLDARDLLWLFYSEASLVPYVL